MKYYDISTLTVEDVKEMLTNGSDKHNNQVRVTKDGKVFLSQDIVGNDETDGLAFRYETFAFQNGYVGSGIEKDKEFIAALYRSLKENWEQYKEGNSKTYIDVF